MRKSRAVDGMSPEEILRRHRETLTEFASRNGIHVVEVFQEIKSGAKLYDRPEMLRLLDAVESGRFQAVLCMDIDRLSRDETRERGRILATFKDAGVLIVTPGKTYDLSEEADELMTELRGLFANYEWRKIRERQQRGLFRAAKEGCYLASTPYGYRKRIIDGKHTLEPYEPEARLVKMAFDLYASGMGCNFIADRLREAGARTRWKGEFTHFTVIGLIRNPVYAGKIVFNRTRWVRENGKIRAVPRPKSEWVCAEGLHPAIVDVEQWEKCQEIMRTRYRPASYDGTIKAPLAGVIRCRQCGGRMQRGSVGGRYYLRCSKRGCSVLARYEDVERAVITGLEDILDKLCMESSETSEREIAEAQARLEAIKSAVASENRKKARLFDFLESGTYSETVFHERMEVVSKRLAALEEQERAALKELDIVSERNTKEQAAGIRTLLNEYTSADAPTKNALLRGIVDVIWYDRPTRKALFSLEIFLR